VQRYLPREEGQRLARDVWSGNFLAITKTLAVDLVDGMGLECAPITKPH
jgi:hypothetical protein